MVQRILSRMYAMKLRKAGWMLCVAVLLPGNLFAANKKGQAAVAAPPDLLLEGGRKLAFERALASERDIRGKP